MAIKTSGKITFPDEINIELGNPVDTVLRFDDPEVLDLIGKSAGDTVRLPDDFYGKSSTPTLNLNVGTTSYIGYNYYGFFSGSAGSIPAFGSWPSGAQVEGIPYNIDRFWAKVASNGYYSHILTFDRGTTNVSIYNFPAYITVSTVRGSLQFERGSGFLQNGRYYLQYNQTAAGGYSPIILAPADNGQQVELSFDF